MMRVFVPLVAGLMLTLTACSTASPTAQPPVAAADPPVTAPAPPPPPQRETAPEEVPAPVVVPPPPAVVWYSPGIGLPLRSDDEAARERKVVMLTFDDGPSDTGTTAQILDVLAEHRVKAMFFITGNGIHNRELAERIHREGHLLAPHSLTHANLTTLTVAEMRAELDPLLALVEEITGERPRYFRPPFGAYNAELLTLLDEYGLELINWTNGSLDWEGVRSGYKEPQLVVDEVMRQLHPGAVVLMHDTLRHTAEALPDLIRSIKAEGYEFVLLNK